jgi:catechol 2,3-dioxygenase-like lactoylglutathione lyase family enzyme
MYGPIHLNVTRIDAHRRFWVETLGAVGPVSTVSTVAQDAAAAFPNVAIVMHHQAPTGGTKGTPVNHIAFAVPDIRAAVDRTRAAGYPIVTRAELPDRFEVQDDLGFIPALETSVAFTMGPDAVKVEFLEVPSAEAPIALHHIHFFSPDAERMLAWYGAMFGGMSGAAPRDRGPFLAVDLPGGVNLTFSPVPDRVVPTRGRVVDRIGLVVEDVNEVRRKLEAVGIVCEGSVFTDPWGTSVEIGV